MSLLSKQMGLGAVGVSLGILIAVILLMVFGFMGRSLISYAAVGFAVGVTLLVSGYKATARGSTIIFGSAAYVVFWVGTIALINGWLE